MNSLFALPILVLSLAGPAAAVEDLTKLLEPLRATAKAPALGAIVIANGKVQAIGAAGIRKFGAETPVTIQDKWHIGSCTKSMTATLAATFVEEGQLTWETTIGEVLGKKMKISDDYKSVPLRDLFSHRSGLPKDVPPKIWASAWKNDRRGNIRSRRLDFVEAILNSPPSSKPGSKYEYSNSGYITAGVMLEVLSRRSWEALMEDRLFKPLGMDSAGFGSPSTKGLIDQPWPHTDPATPKPQGPGDDNPQMLGPAGTVHASLSDLAKYVQMHMVQNTGPVLKHKESFTTLHTNAEGNKDYALGWSVVSREWAGGAVLSHNGTNVMNYCSIWAAPNKNFAVITVTNFGGKNAGKLCDDAASALIQRFARQASKPPARPIPGTDH